jgi:hypothetical protein
MKFREFNNNAVSSSDSFLLDTTDPKDPTSPLVWTRRHAVTTVDVKARSLIVRLQQIFKDIFLPVGYPTSVAEGYLEYQLYDSLQGLCTYLRGVVATSAVLVAAGVGDAQATAMSAAMTWAIRDGFGMVGGLLFSYKASPHFDAHVKEFRFLADVFNDIGLTLDLSLPILLARTSSVFELSWMSAYLPSPYLLLTSTSTLCKVWCGICAGATKGNISHHFAISGNISDVNAKESTQETLVSLIGMCMGVGLARWLHCLERKGERNEGDNLLANVQLISWTIFILMTMIHIWANFVGIQQLQFRTLNESRAKVLLQPVIEICSNWVVMKDESVRISAVVETCVSMCMSPNQVNESLWSSLLGMFRKGNIVLGIRLRDLIKITSESKWSRETWKNVNDTFLHQKYVILIDEDATKSSQPRISVLMKVGASDCDEMKAFVNAHILHCCMQKETFEVNKSRLLLRSAALTECLFRKSKHDIDIHSSLLQLGWDLSRLYLGFSPWRCDWNGKDD